MWGPIGLRFIIDCDTFWGLMNMQWGRWCDLFLRPIPPFLRSVGSLPPIHYYPIYLMAFIGIRLLGAFCHLFRIDLPSPAVFHTLFALLLLHLHWEFRYANFPFDLLRNWIHYDIINRKKVHWFGWIWSYLNGYKVLILWTAEWFVQLFTVYRK